MRDDMFDLSDVKKEPLELIISLGKAQLEREGYKRANSYGQLLRAAKRAIECEYDRIFNSGIPEYL